MAEKKSQIAGYFDLIHPPKEDLHSYSARNRQELERSSTCGCFYCRRVFKPDEISQWCDEGETALCPFCGIDSIVGNDSGITPDKDLLEEMNREYFSTSPKKEV